ncbi:MAG: Trm112 family protein [Armatimonadota bacterium]|nr:Trm112 family protein [Armatimonadota bacterium]
MVDERLLEILVCPKCKEDIRLEDDWLICDECRLKYPIRDGIPIMLVDEAEPLEGGEQSEES